jgi:hypothetical protein
MDILLSMREIIDNLQWRIKNTVSGEYSFKGEVGDEGGGTLETPSPSSSSSSSKESEHSSHKNKSSKKYNHNPPLLKLDVKFELSTSDGELNAINWTTRSRK